MPVHKKGKIPPIELSEMIFERFGYSEFMKKTLRETLGDHAWGSCVRAANDGWFTIVKKVNGVHVYKLSIKALSRLKKVDICITRKSYC